MYRYILATLAVVIGLSLASQALAQSRPAHEGAGLPQPGELAKALSLTDAQKQQVEAIVRNARAEAEKAADPKAKQQVRHSAIEQIEKVLTDDQKAKFAHFLQERRQQGAGQGAHPLLDALKQLNLTDAQKTQVEQILKQARQDAEKAANQPVKRQIHQAAVARIRIEVLTDAQRQQLQQILGNEHQGQGQAGHSAHPRTGAAKHAPASRPA